MAVKTFLEDASACPDSQIGASLDALATTIAARKGGLAQIDPNDIYSDEANLSYTQQLLAGNVEKLSKKINEEALECAMAAKDVEAAKDLAERDIQLDHLRYECGDLLYHLMVLCARFDISTDELAAELNSRMRSDERAPGCILLKEEHIKRHV